MARLYQIPMKGLIAYKNQKMLNSEETLAQKFVKK